MGFLERLTVSGWREHVAQRTLRQAEFLRGQQQLDASKNLVDNYIQKHDAPQPTSQAHHGLATLQEMLRSDISRRRDCINSRDVINLENIADIPRQRFVKTADGYGHDALQLAQHWLTRVENPATRVSLTAADVEAVRQVPGAKTLVLRATRKYQRHALRFMAESKYAEALRELHEATLLDPKCLDLQLMRVDCLTAQGEFAAAAEIMDSPLVHASTAWRVQIRDFAVRGALTGEPAQLPLPPLREQPREIIWAAMTCLHCGSYEAALQLSRCTSNISFAERRLKKISEWIGTKARGGLDQPSPKRPPHNPS